MAGETRERYEHIYIALHPDESVRGAHVGIVEEVQDSQGNWRTVEERAMGLAISNENGMYAKLEEVIGAALTEVTVERENLRNQKAFLEQELDTIKGQRDQALGALAKIKEGSDALASAYVEAVEELKTLRKAEASKS